MYKIDGKITIGGREITSDVIDKTLTPEQISQFIKNKTIIVVKEKVKKEKDNASS